MPEIPAKAMLVLRAVQKLVPMFKEITPNA
jgi:hypothetical protein